MSLPPLRQPKIVNNVPLKKCDLATHYVILTLKTDEKLVIPSDGYHGIIMAGGIYKCVFCNYSFAMDEKIKDLHVNSTRHHKMLNCFPHMEEFAENLLRQINKENFYCSICNVVVSQYFTRIHLTSEVHNEELKKAVNRAAIYKPVK